MNLTQNELEVLLSLKQNADMYTEDGNFVINEIKTNKSAASIAGTLSSLQTKNMIYLYEDNGCYFDGKITTFGFKILAKQLEPETGTGIRNKVVTIEIATKLQKLGFNEPCMFGFNSENALKSNIAYDNNASNDDINSINKYDAKIPAPLWQEVIDWFREKYDIHLTFEPVYRPHYFNGLKYCYVISTKENGYNGMGINLSYWLKVKFESNQNLFHVGDSLYEVRKQGVLEVLEMIKK